MNAKTDNVFKIGTSRLILVSLTLMYYFGIKPKNNSTVAYTIVGYTCHTITSLGWTVAKLIGTLIVENKKEMIMWLPTCIYAGIGVYRTFVFMRKYKAVDISLNAIADFSLNEGECEIVHQKIKVFCKWAKACPAFIFIAFISAVVNPLVTNERVMPAPIWLPYNDWKGNDRDFYITYIYSVVAMLPMFVVCSFLPIIVWYLLYASSLTLDVLGQRLQYLGNAETDNKKVFADLLKCIKLHQQIVKNIEKIQDTFSNLFFIQIAASAVCLCSIAYLMTTASISEDFNNFAMYVALAGMYGLEIFVLIYYANEIAHRSEQLPYCMFESNWTNMSVKYRKLIIIAVEKWKKPQELVVGKIFSMRIKILTSILNVAYSILNVLRKEQQ